MCPVVESEHINQGSVDYQPLYIIAFIFVGRKGRIKGIKVRVVILGAGRAYQ